MASKKIASFALVALMLIGGLFMWIGSPYIWVRVTAANATSQSLSVLQVLFILVAIAVTGFIMVNVLAWLNELHERLNGRYDEGPERMTWTQSMSDGRSSGRPTSALDKIMVLCVLAAVVGVAIWFFFFADETLHHGQKRSSVEGPKVVAVAPPGTQRQL